MTAREAFDYFRQECEKSNVTIASAFVLGRGSSPYNGRYHQQISKRRNCLYAVQYCKDIETFVAWDLRIKHGRGEDYTVKREPLLGIKDNNLHYIKKNLEYSNWREETVIAFKPAAIKNFLITHVLSYIN